MMMMTIIDSKTELISAADCKIFRCIFVAKTHSKCTWVVIMTYVLFFSTFFSLALQIKMSDHCFYFSQYLKHTGVHLHVFTNRRITNTDGLHGCCKNLKQS